METCDFCNKTQHQVNKIILGEAAGICDSCVKLCSEILLGEKFKDSLVNVPDVDPVVLKEHLDKYVVSQDSAKTILSVAVSNHFKRINSADKHLAKSNVMLLGPTGSGKTLLVQTIANFLQIPFVIADATTLTESGYVGADVDSVLIKLLQAANGNIKKAQTGIIFLDEIDKIARRGSSNRDVGVGGEGVQQALLKLVEGSVFSIAPNRKTDDVIEIDTSNILFIASGAFVNIDKIKRKASQPTTIGFNADVTKKTRIDTEFSDLIQFGMIPEFTTRFPIIAEVEELSADDMLSVLSKVENNLITQYKHLFKYSDVKLTFDKDALTQLVNIAMIKKVGARGLRSIIEKALLPHMFNMNKYADNNINKVRITKSLINNPKEVKKS